MKGFPTKQMIKDRILPILNPVNREKESNTYFSEKGALINILPDVDCRIEKYGKPIGNTAAGSYTPIRLLKGKHILTFISEENEQDRIEITYSVADNDMEDFIKVELLPIVNARKAGEQKAREQERQKQLLSTPDENIEKYKDEKDKFGFRIKSTGEVIVLPKYDNARSFSEGLAAVKLNGKYGFIDKTGKEIIPLIYDNVWVWDFNEGLAKVKLNGKWFYIDKNGKEIPHLNNKSVNFRDDMAKTELNNKNKQEIPPLKYDYISPFVEGLARVKLNGKYGFIDKTGKVVIPLIYDAARDFHEGLALVILNDKVGFIDKTGKVVIPLIYDDTWDFSKGFARVKLNGKWFYIDKNGKEKK